MNLFRHDHILALRAALLDGNDALRAFAQWRQAIAFEDIDSDTLRMVPRIYRNIRSLGSDEPILERMKGVYRHTWVSNRLRLAACEELLGIMNAAEVPSMLLKGAAVLVRWTSDSGLRRMDDVDVLVPREQARAAFACLLGAGYKPVAFRADRFTDREFGSIHGVGLRNPAGMHIDLHWRALLNGRAQDQDRAFWDRALPVRLADSTAHVLSPEDHLYHTCAHAASWNDGARIDWAADAVMILREVGDQFDWDRLVAHARRDGIELPVRGFVALLRDDLDIPVPRIVDRQLRSFRPSLFARLDLALRRRARDKIGAAGAAFLAFQDHRRKSACLSRKPLVAAISPFVSTYWQFDSIPSALTYGMFAALDRPPRLRPLLASRARRPLTACDLPGIDIGQLDFSLVDAWHHPFVTGWSLPEARGRWTDGHEAILAIRNADPRAHDLPVRMKLQPFLPGGELTVEVWANRHQVDLWHFFPEQQQRPWHAFTVDGKMINERDTIEFTFVIRPPRSPFAFNQSADRRQLGLFVEKACFGYRVCHDAFGRVLDFRSASVDTELLWNGWSTPEPTGCWTDGPQAVVGLRLPNRPASDISVAIEASVFGGAENQSDAPITISANGTHVADVDRSSGPPRQLLFTIPHAAIEDDGMLALTIDVPNPISPATLGLSPDTRQIGLHLTKLVMSS